MYQSDEVIDLEKFKMQLIEDDVEVLNRIVTTDFPTFIQKYERLSIAVDDCYCRKWNMIDDCENCNAIHTFRQEWFESLTDVFESVTDKSVTKELTLNNIHCSVCYAVYAKQYITNVDGTYKYTHEKYQSYVYKLCPLCLYFASTNEIYANICSRRCTGDADGMVRFRPYGDGENKFKAWLKLTWCFVHPNIPNSDYIREHKHLPIDERFCLENR